MEPTSTFLNITSETFHGNNSVSEGPACSNFEQNALTFNYHPYEDVFETLLVIPKLLPEENKVKSKIYQCEICNKEFDNIRRYSGHIRVHTKENLWSCEKCPAQKFLTRRLLMQHIKAFHSATLRRHHCMFCPLTFEINSRLKHHIAAMHFNERLHTCQQCKKVFNKKSDLKKHEELHEGNKNHVCSHCGRKFSDGSNLRRHIAIHTKDKLYICWACKCRFTQLASLKRHTTRCDALQSIPLEYEISYSKKYHCKICGIPFPYQSELTEHIASVHKSPETDPERDRKDKKNVEHDKHADAIMDNVQCCDQNKDLIENEKHANKKPLPKLCGMTLLNNKNNIVEHSISVHKPLEQHDKENRYLDRGKSVDAFVNELLFGNDNNISNNPAIPRNDTMNIQETDGFLKEMNQLYSIDDELLYNDIDFDYLHASQLFNTETDVNLTGNDEIFFDYNESNRSIDQDLMNVLYQVKAEHLPDELLHDKEKQVNTQSNSCTQKPSNCLESTLSVDDCSTIFEKDVDLEASTNLAANLNQLIGDNDVQYISTENDDTFIISLKNNIDAEQLTDMLNIDIELINDSNGNNNKNSDKELHIDNNQSAVDSNSVNCVQETHCKGTDKRDKTFVCNTCNKKFNKKDNYKSHIATHDPLLQRHHCGICGDKFSYRSTLNKHVRAAHEPRVARAHTCPLCSKPYKAAWMLKDHMQRNHFNERPFVCDHEDCDKKFFKHSDLLAHKRTHTGERPYRCDVCERTFPQSTHLARHRRTVHRVNQRKSNDLVTKEDNLPLLQKNRKEGNKNECAPKEKQLIENNGFWK